MSQVNPTTPEGVEDALAFAVQEYHRILLAPEGEHARVYLSERGITHKTLTRYRVGYAPYDWSFLVRHKGSPEKEALQAADLIRPRQDGTGMYDTFRGRIMMPYTQEGQILGFSGRVLPEYEDNSHRYNNTRGMPKSRQLYGWEEANKEIMRQGTVYLAEGQIDTLALVSAGRQNVLGIGRAMMSRMQVARVAELGCEVVLVPDNDATGRLSILRNAEKLASHGVDVRVATLESGKDASEVLQIEGPEALYRETAQSRHILQIAPAVIEQIWSEENTADIEAPEWMMQYINRFQTSEHERLLGTVADQKEIRALFTQQQEKARGRKKPQMQAISTEGRISKEFIDRVRSEIPLVTVISRYTKLEPSGENWKGCCPAHKDTDPSFFVHNEKGFHCFGCGFGGRNAIDFVMRQEDVGFLTAVRKLAEDFDMDFPALSGKKPSTGRNWQEVIEAASPYWVEPEKAMESLKELGVNKGSEAVLETLKNKPSVLSKRTEKRFTMADADRLHRLYEQSHQRPLKTAKEPAFPEKVIEKEHSKRAYHHVYMALKDTYKNPEEAYRRLEGYYQRGKTEDVQSRPELLGALRSAPLKERIRRNGPRQRAKDIVRRYGAYMEEEKAMAMKKVPPAAALRKAHQTRLHGKSSGLATRAYAKTTRISSTLYRVGRHFFER